MLGVFSFRVENPQMYGYSEYSSYRKDRILFLIPLKYLNIYHLAKKL